jgi:hypothetical protein
MNDQNTMTVNMGRLIGKEARKCQTWTLAGLLVSRQLIANLTYLRLIGFEQNQENYRSAKIGL